MPVNPYEPPKDKPEALDHDGRGNVDSSAIEYAVDVDDMLAFNRFHLSRSPAMRRQRFGFIGFACLPAAVVCVLSLPDHSLLFRMSVATFAAGVTALVIQWSLDRSIATQIKKLHREGSNDGIFGNHELRIGDAGLTETTDVNETRHAFSGITRIEETDDYAFIYISSVQAHVVPKNQISRGDIVSFIAQLRQQVAAAGDARVSK